jgi:hypothetical protein
MLIKLINIERSKDGQSSLREVYVNTSHITSVSEIPSGDESVLVEKQLLGFMKEVSFSQVVILEGGRSRFLTVVGTPTEIYQKINKKQILKG